MSIISTVKAFTNGEIGYVSWVLNGMIPGCLGFEVTRLYPDNAPDNTILPAWVAFKGQSNKKWLPQDTSVWPVQKLSWKDLTLRKRRDQTDRRADNSRVQYMVRPIVAYQPGLAEVKTNLEVSYTGAPVRLSYFDAGKKSDIITISLDHGPIRATFTNGILATQWLAHAMQNPTFKGIKKAIKDKKDPIRKYLAGDVLDTLKSLMDKAAATPKASLRMALYELEDDELMESILAIKGKVEIILANTSKNKKGEWDVENSPNRKILHAKGATVTDRMFNNNSIGHNKFIIYLENNKPLMVMTGSTNWTSSGLCAQSNNASIINSPEIASLYNDYFELLLTDTKDFKAPKPKSSAATKNVQGEPLRTSNSKGNGTTVLADGTKVTVWFSPNTPHVSVNKNLIPPDLSQVYSVMRKANKAIFFAVFLPGRANNIAGTDVMTNIIMQAISLGMKDHSLMVYGAISDPTAMPNYVNPVKGKKGPPTPYTYDEGKMHIVRAANLTGDKKDLIGDFQKELLKTPGGHAIIHDKIVVVDPFSDNGAVIFGSHNEGFKASYGNDENLLIIQNNPSLVKAFALHVLDIFEHYRFRAIQAEQKDNAKNKWDGFLSLDDLWLKNAMAAGGKGDLAEYITS
jgi:phosphatidylserine/phosphatidylglycerophosphate/cardiolipin synthase-like enzyme